MEEIFKERYLNSKEAKSLIPINRKEDGSLPNLPKDAKQKEGAPFHKNFERRMWEILFYMGPAYINDPKGYEDKLREFNFDMEEIPECQNDYYQVDNVAILGNKFILINECKATETGNKYYTLNDYFEKYYVRRRFIKRRINKIFKVKLYPIFLTSTKGYQWTPKAKSDHLKKREFITLSEIEQQYLSDCWDISRNDFFVFNQFLGFFKKGSHLYEDTSVVAFETTSKKLGRAFTFSISAEKMMQLSCVAHKKAKNIFEAQETGGIRESHYQRVLKKKRISDISAHIDKTEEPFKNNILASFRGNKKHFTFERGSMEKKGEGRGGVLNIKGYPGAFHIIDGQHRLFGYAGVTNKSLLSSHKLIVTAFEDIDESQEASLFIEVNRNQTKVDTALMQEVERLIGFSKTGRDQVLHMCSAIVQDLRDIEDSPFFSPKAIKESEFNTSKGASLTITDLTTSLSQSRLFGTNDFTKGLLANSDDFNKTLDFGFEIISWFFNQIKESAGELWTTLDTIGRIIKSNENMLINYFIGGLFIVLGRIIAAANLGKDLNISTIKTDIQPYVDLVCKSIQNLSEEDKEYLLGIGDENQRKKFRGQTGAPYLASIFIQQFLSKEFPSLLTKADIKIMAEKDERRVDLDEVPTERKALLRQVQKLEREKEKLEKDLDKARKYKKIPEIQKNKNKIAQNHEQYFRLKIHQLLQKEKGKDYFEKWVKKESPGTKLNKIWSHVRDLEESDDRNDLVNPYKDYISYCNLVDACELLIAIEKAKPELKKQIDEMFRIKNPDEAKKTRQFSTSNQFGWARFMNQMRRYNNSGHSSIDPEEDPSDTELANDLFNYYHKELESKKPKIESYI